MLRAGLRHLSLLIGLSVLVSAPLGLVLGQDRHAESAAVITVLTDQVKAWNRGDLPAFVRYYAPHCMLVGNGISELTREQVLEHYQRKYPTAESRGVLAFRELKVRLLDPETAIAAGQWHVQRAGTAGSSIGGVFSVVLLRGGGTWQIVLDHTSSAH